MTNLWSHQNGTEQLFCNEAHTPLRRHSRGKKYQLMKKSHPHDGTEQTIFVPEVAKQHDVFASAITFGFSAASRAIVFLDKNKSETPRVLQPGFAKKKNHSGPVRESNPGPLAPKARMMPVDQQAKLGKTFLR